MAKVTVYSTPACPWCVKAKEFLESEGIEFEEKNVAEDEEARDEMAEKSGQRGVPVLDIDGTIIVGFDVEKIRSALAKGKKKMKKGSN